MADGKNGDLFLFTSESVGEGHPGEQLTIDLDLYNLLLDRCQINDNRYIYSAASDQHVLLQVSLECFPAVGSARAQGVGGCPRPTQFDQKSLETFCNLQIILS